MSNTKETVLGCPAGIFERTYLSQSGVIGTVITNVSWMPKGLFAQLNKVITYGGENIWPFGSERVKWNIEVKVVERELKI